MRGDGLTSKYSFASLTGSPPRAWGRPLAEQDRGAVLRFTPTCVGTARFPKIAPASNPVHPHVRGDGVVALHHRSSPVGSPPRAWGRLVVCQRFKSVRRFTPTCVGTADRPVFQSASCPVHPHVRGDGVNFRFFAFSHAGSPPRAWGRLVVCQRFKSVRRFTPTCVGTADIRIGVTSLDSVHPHVRGDGWLGLLA